MGVVCLKFCGENFHRWLQNHEIREGFLPQNFPAIWEVTVARVDEKERREDLSPVILISVYMHIA